MFEKENLEEEVRKFWDKNKTEKKALALNEKAEPYYFLDGPPYATGHIHMGTAWNKILKDFYLRYHRMTGKNVWARPGYDCHGLPTELKIEKKLGIKDKKEIESRIGIARFNEECYKFSTEFIGTMNQEFANLGVWMDWDNTYRTLDKDYIEAGWFTFKTAYDKGLVYKDKYTVHVCSSCETVVSNNEVEYQKVTDESVYVKLKVKGAENEYLIIWTTTPWTLPSNTGVIAHPDFEYVKIELKKGEKWILAKELVDSLMEKIEVSYKTLDKFKGRKLKDLEYETPFHDLPLQKEVKAKIVLNEEYVNLEQGTGLVHCAPGHGTEDFLVGRENNLPALCPLTMTGEYTEEAGKYAGKYVKDADSELVEELREKGLLVTTEKIKHDYPMCWRCKTPLLFMAMPQWFIKVSSIRKKIISDNKKNVKWAYGWAGKRFEDWLQNMGDWPISRQRYWGIPVPIWECQKEDCDEIKVIGSVKELGKDTENLHRQFVDPIEFKCKCGDKMKRIEDILDVWFDSGIAPWASVGYPQKEKPFKSLWPVDFILEGSDQTRGWFNSLAVCGMLTFDRIPYVNVVQHALVLAEGGLKMSKSLGNIVSPDEVIEKYGRDHMRHYLLYYDPAEDFVFSWEKMKDVNRFFNTWKNTVKFQELYGSREKLPSKLELADRWILSMLNSLIQKVQESNEKYYGFKSVQAMQEFIVNDLSRWYIKLVRERLWPTYTGSGKKAAQATLYHILDTLNTMMAPVLVHMSEAAYQDIFRGEGDEESVHFRNFPKENKKHIDKKLEGAMGETRLVVEAVAVARQESGIKLRWPVKKVTISTKNEVLKKEFKEILISVLNAKNVEFADSAKDTVKIDHAKGVIFLDKTVDTELEREWMIKELGRHVQGQRKKAGLKIEDKINLTVDSPMNTQFENADNLISEKIGLDSYSVGKLKGKNKSEFEFRGKKVSVAF
ncbi:TPA: isoleucine--tRNA ligase [archaeon]|uniref:Isoleucine--tRNA ligase n=1 Tax=Candidatus Undinarchaeum marinum TaxID=2756141 RepID=A0A832UYW9_9ARCH|nr:isoleucine--tRNA ligase [Candidatus Undinarchaeum marinum]